MTIIKIDGEIGWSISAREIKRQLDEASGDITVEISSPGGSVYQGVSIFNALKAYDKGEVTTIITSIAASMASYIALAGDTVKAYDNAVYMIHNASIFTWGDHRELRKDANLVESLSKLLSKKYVSRTGKDEKEIFKLMDDETYFFGDEILNAGFVDELIPTDEDSDEGSAMAIAVETVKACVKTMQSSEIEEDAQEVAALLKVVEIPKASAKIENNPKGESMGKTYTEDEHAEALKSGSDTAVADERKRVSGIMALNGDEALKTKAIDDGSSVGDVAIALNEANATATQKVKTDFEAAADDLNDNVVATDDNENLSEDAKNIKADDEAFYEKRGAK